MGQVLARYRRDEKHPDVAQHERAARDIGHHARAEMDEIVTVDRTREADGADRDDRRALAQARDDEVQRLPAGHERRAGIAHVHEGDESNDEAGSLRAELPAALNHLRHAELRALRRVKRHEDRADQISDEDRNHARNEGLMEYRRRERSGDDGEHVEIGAEPEREQLARLAVPLIERNLVDRMRSMRDLLSLDCNGALPVLASDHAGD